MFVGLGSALKILARILAELNSLPMQAPVNIWRGIGTFRPSVHCPTAQRFLRWPAVPREVYTHRLASNTLECAGSPK